MQARHNILYLAGVLPLFTLLHPPHQGEFRSRQIILHLTFGETGVEQVNTTPVIPDDEGREYNHENDGGKEDDDHAILPPLFNLLVELRLQVDDSGGVVLFIEVMINLIQALTEFCHTPQVTLTLHIGNQLPIGLDGDIGRQGA